MSYWPSLKTYQRIPAGQSTTVAERYDYVDTATRPVSWWFGQNPNVIVDQYFHALELNLIGDSSGSPSSDADRSPANLWYEWAAANGNVWETGFMHLGTADAEVTQSMDGYSQQDDKIRYVLLGSSATNQADKAWAGTADLLLDAVGDCIYFGRLDRFDRVEITLLQPAALAWHGVWEYWNGSAWTALTVTDGTNDLQNDGWVTWTPPTEAQWARCKVNGMPTWWGTQGVRWIRFRTTEVKEVHPRIKKVRGRGYWTHSATSNIIPAWDDANDPDGDGYAEDPTGNPSATALFKYESRFPHFWAWCQFGCNLTDATFRGKLIDFIETIINAQATGGFSYQGIQLDDMSGVSSIPTACKGKVLEYPGLNASETAAAHVTDMGTYCAEAKVSHNAAGYDFGANVGWKGDATINDNLDFLVREDASGSGGVGRYNTPGYSLSLDDNLFAVDSEMRKAQALNKPQLWQWQLALYIKLGESSKSVTATAGSTTLVGASTSWLTTMTAGSFLSINGHVVEVASVTDNTHLELTAAWAWATYTGTAAGFLTRDKMAGLAFFLCVQNAGYEYFSMWYGYTYSYRNSLYYNWIPACTTDFGTPTGVVPTGKTAKGDLGCYVLQSGADPSKPAFTYEVYAREYTGGFAIYRPPVITGSYGNDSAVTVTLPHAMRQVSYDGSVGEPISSIVLRGGEGAVFLEPNTLTADAGDDVTISEGDSTTLAGSASGGVSPYGYSWTPTAGLSNPLIAGPEATPTGTRVYTLVATDSLAATASDSVTISVIPGPVPGPTGGRMTRLQIINMALREWGEGTSPAHFGGTTPMVDWFNDVKKQFELETRCVWGTVATAVTAATRLAAISTAMFHPVYAYYGNTALDQVKRDDLTDSGHLTLTGAPSQWYIGEGFNRIGLYPIPKAGAGGTLTLEGYKTTRDLTGDGSIPSIPPQFHRALVAGLKLRMAEEDDDNSRNKQAFERAQNQYLNYVVMAQREAWPSKPRLMVHRSWGK